MAAYKLPTAIVVNGESDVSIVKYVADFYAGKRLSALGVMFDSSDLPPVYGNCTQASVGLFSDLVHIGMNPEFALCFAEYEQGHHVVVFSDGHIFDASRENFRICPAAFFDGEILFKSADPLALMPHTKLFGTIDQWDSEYWCAVLNHDVAAIAEANDVDLMIEGTTDAL